MVWKKPADEQKLPEKVPFKLKPGEVARQKGEPAGHTVIIPLIQETESQVQD